MSRASQEDSISSCPYAARRKGHAAGGSRIRLKYGLGRATGVILCFNLKNDPDGPANGRTKSTAKPDMVHPRSNAHADRNTDGDPEGNRI